jgi:nucleotide-binding universal stress UspA family protein
MVRLLLVHQPRLDAAPMADGVFLNPEEDDAIRDRERSYLEAFLSRLEPDDRATATADVLEGRPGPMIASEADSWKADLVVMTTHGRGPIGRFWLGSVADYLVRHLSVPIVLLRPEDDADWQAADLELRTILVPVDFSPESRAILEPVISLALNHEARVELVHVVEPALGPGPLPVGPTPDVPDIDQRTRAAAEDSLAAIALSLRERGVEAAGSVLVSLSVAGALIERIRETRPDLVAIATHGRGGIRRALLGSVADKVIRGSHRPLLVLRPPG